MFKFLGLGILFVAFSATAAPYKLDTAHTSVGFSIKHLVVSNVKGQFNKFEGSFDFDEKKAEVSKVNVKIDASSIDTNDAKRDDHLRSPDFFEVAKYPSITFTADKVEYKNKKPAKVVGTLTMKGESKPVTLDIAYGGTVVDPSGNEKVGFTLTGKIKRKDWGLNWNKSLDKGGLALGEDVAIQIEGEANKVKEAK